MSPKFCPRCGGPRIRPSSTFWFGIGPLQYACEDCGYYGPIVMQADNIPLLKTQRFVDISVIKCSNCGRDNPPEFKYCGQCGVLLHRDETKIYE